MAHAGGADGSLCDIRWGSGSPSSRGTEKPFAWRGESGSGKSVAERRGGFIVAAFHAGTSELTTAALTAKANSGAAAHGERADRRGV